MNDAERYAETIAAELAELEAGRVDGEPHGTPWAAVLDWAETCALDVEVGVSIPHGHVQSVTITRTVGGPGCWIESNGTGGYVTVRAAWGGDVARRDVLAPTLEAWAWETAEGWADAHVGVRA